MASTYEALLLAQVSYMQTNVVQLVAQQAIASTTASVTFSSLPSNYNHFKVIWKARGDTAATVAQLRCQLNGGTGNSYVWQNIQAHNTSVTGSTNGGADTSINVGVVTTASATANYDSGGEIIFPYVTDTTNRAIVLGTSIAVTSSTDSYAGTYGGLGPFGSAINNIKIFPSTGNFVSGLFSIYGWA